MAAAHDPWVMAIHHSRQPAKRRELRLMNSASVGHGITVFEPKSKTLLEVSQNRALKRRSGVINDHVVGVMPMSCFHQLVRAYQIHRIRCKTMVPNKWMKLNDTFYLFCSLRLGRFKYFFPVFHT